MSSFPYTFGGAYGDKATSCAGLMIVSLRRREGQLHRDASTPRSLERL